MGIVTHSYLLLPIMLGTQWGDMPGCLPLIFNCPSLTLGVIFFIQVSVFLSVVHILLRPPKSVFYTSVKKELPWSVILQKKSLYLSYWPWHFKGNTLDEV